MNSYIHVVMYVRHIMIHNYAARTHCIHIAHVLHTGLLIGLFALKIMAVAKMLFILSSKSFIKFFLSLRLGRPLVASADFFVALRF